MEHTLRLPSQKPAIVLATEEASPPHMVTFEQPDGSSRSLSYLDLRGVRYDPAGLVRLRFSSYNVLLQGSNLLSVWRALRSRRVKLVRVCAYEATADHEPHIDSITITPAPRWE